MTPSFPELTPTQANAQLARYRVVDVREPHEFHGPLGRVESAELVPLATLAERAETLAGSQPLLLVCRSGKRSGTACERLQQLGVRDVSNLAGGMIGWNRVGLPVRHSAPESLTALVDQIVAWLAQLGPLSTEAALDAARERLREHGVSREDPSRAAVEALIGFVGESLADLDPPDLDLSLASFHRSLAAL